jgi:hypothetical protein
MPLLRSSRHGVDAGGHMSDPRSLQIDAVTGDVSLPVGLTVGASLSRAAFEATPPATSARSRGAASAWVHRTFDAGHVEDDPLLCTLTFHRERLVSSSFAVSLYPPGTDDGDAHSLDVERRMKGLHDTLLTDMLGTPNRRALAAGIAEPALALTLVWEFRWGRIMSCYDSRRGGTSIRFLYLDH